ncbi:MAG: glutamate synthase subunit beta [Candidatus Omnitrophica bacterium]|nr:glutamate synthase subunit beta [Candidatus Omnitrophota bacterium]
MADPRGFLKIKRKERGYRPVCERIKDYSQIALERSSEQTKQQASRCMDCGTPFCHYGCPLGNYIPETNDLVYRNQWKEALKLLVATNPLADVTGRVCPALCEYACVLGINDEPVTIRDNELDIIERAFKEGYINPCTPKRRTGKSIAIVGSGPAGLALADQLNCAGHKVTVFERDDKIGGILRYGIPDFKLEKHILDRRISLWEKEGIIFKTKVEVGKDYSVGRLLQEFDVTCLCCGCRKPRDILIPGRQLKGIYFAMDYLTQVNRRVAGQQIKENEIIDARGKKVVVIGGGDTGADCVGTAHRQGAQCVVQLEIMPKPPSCRTESMPWPTYPMTLKVSSSHQEGGERMWSVLTKEFIGDTQVRKIKCKRLEYKYNEEGCLVMEEIPGSEFELEADLVFICVGFLHTEHEGIVKQLGLALDQKGNIKTDERYMTSCKNVFSCGDMRRGQSLVVWAIADARRCAYAIDTYLMGKSNLLVM